MNTPPQQTFLQKYIFGLIILLIIILGIIIYSININQKPTLQDYKAPLKCARNIIKWSKIFTPSVLSHKEKCKELSWFRDKALPFRGMKIKSIGKDIETNYWIKQHLARAFHEITGIEVIHEVIGAGEVVNKLMEATNNNKNDYDIFISDADLVGLHMRTQKIVTLSDYMEGEGKEYTNPYLALDDFINLDGGKDYEGNLLQIPDYQFILVYWFRHDWFSDPFIKNLFKEEYGYELGVPLNWSAYEDIAQFFNKRRMRNPNDSEVIAYGHADYGKPGPWLGARFSDSFFGLAGVGDPGIPNGFPVDEWGIRVENKIPVGASIGRGGALNGPAAIYALDKWIELLNKYSPPKSKDLDWLEFGPIVAKGNIAQSWYWCNIYAATNHEYNKIGSPVCDRKGNPVWRVAPMPRGKYWQKGMKMGHMDSGSWTIPITTIGSKRHAAWLWAQFSMSKTVALKKFEVGLTPVRKSTLYSEVAEKNRKRLGGLLELMRSKEIINFTDTGLNVPHYPKMSALWSKNISMATEGKKTAQEALNNLAQQFDSLMETINRNHYMLGLNEKKTEDFWLNKSGSPKKEILGRASPKTIPYEELLKSWKDNIK